jgi:monovalent cation:H+ antiporter-2, CPA2 family
LHLPPLISDLGLILLVAGFVTVVFKRIGQPVVLGYLIAGFLVGPETSFFPTVQDKAAIKIWAEIGVIVLLFGLGLEFSFKKLMAVGRGASITAATEISFMFGLGFLVGQAFGWGYGDSLFLGGIISISSTTIILRAFEELGLRQRGFVQLVYGVLIVEDLVAVLLMVVLPTIALTKSFEGQQLVSSVAKLGFFLSIWFVAGTFLLPQILGLARRHINDETILIVSLGLCFLMVTLATSAGFSAALGAFIMGSILAETKDGERILRTLNPIKNLFSAIFFVSVGMLIEIQPLREHWVAVLTISSVVVFGKAIGVGIGATIGGQSIRTAIQSGLSHTQIGEFSFIIATLGLSLNIISDFLYPIAVSVSAITTLTTPYLIRAGEPISEWICSKAPASFRNRVQGDLKSSVVTESTGAFQGELIRLLLNTVVIIAIGIVTKVWLQPFLERQFGVGVWAEIACMTIALLAALPMLWAIVNGAAIMKSKGYGIEAIRDLTTQAVFVLGARLLMAHFLLAFLISQFVSALWAFAVVGAIAISIGFVGARNFSKIYVWLERKFLSNLNEKELFERKQKSVPQLAPWDAHLSRVQVSPDSSLVARRLSEIGVREKYGVTVAMIERGSRQILAPRRDEFVMAFDQLIVIGTDDQLTSFAFVAEAREEESREENSSAGYVQPGARYELKSVSLGDHHKWIGKSIRESGIREASDGLVVGLERSGQRILNPDATITLEVGDHVWIVGDPGKIAQL